MSDVLSKKALDTEEASLIAWVRFTYAIPFLILLIPFIDFPRLDLTFFIMCLVLIPLEVTAVLLYIKAIKISPLFLVITSYLILGELPDTSGFIGILFVVTGAYLLNIHTVRQGIFEPLRAIGREKGAILMIAVAFIFSISSNLGKVAIQHSNPLFFAVFYPPLLSFSLLPIMLFRTSSKRSNSDSRGKFNKLFRRKIFYIIGLCIALESIFHFSAITLIEVSYMISVKRTSILF